ncbi:RecQ family ATP-dependent DNA helicase [Dysgonomonas sp. 216]|uniref:RecQ family ATP-dependent DNA helicase n=1 Tax=Dysgonomonas sp. 216 TaxID=2302934 RepID=UPI0013D715E4|nr:ATP-dependent DNA helicase RecQ [Dysgonomonas sp. 216]NDW19529.1 RecQ family ATP-dependent DNA helicase [Dysgonomonas sp. 216]
MQDIYHKILYKYWGYTSFRPLQEDIIHSIAEGYDTLGLMPTGGGKSLTFQVPAMAKQGICIVITPLIALMKDQVDNLKARGIKALAVYSGMTRQEIITTLENAILGDYKFLYISPERLGTDLFLSKLKSMDVCMLVVDEAHCISQWGYDFRPSYMNIVDIRNYFPEIPILALTATATPEVVTDIQKSLKFRKENVFRKSFLRSNLAYIVYNTENKIGALMKILNKYQGSSIVYVRSRQRTKEFAQDLQKAGYSADFYHAGLSGEEKSRKQNAWKNNMCRIMVTTNAFGMGIDKPDVRLVVHMDLPNAIEEYFQEAGRAGRDEEDSYAVILYSRPDSTKLKKRIADEFPERDFILQVYEHLAYFLQVAEGAGFDRVFDFNLHQFCHVYKYPILPTHNALKILDLAGYIEYTEEIDNRSRLIFTVYRDELYNIELEKGYDLLINTILRLYTGLFTDYATIDEAAVAVRMGKDRKDVYEMLKILSKRKIIDYIPHKKTPLIVYTSPRVDIRHVSIPKKVYEDRKSRFKLRIEAMTEYVERMDVCRSRLLLNYFGEENSIDCGRCDVCLSRRRTILDENEFVAIRTEITNILLQEDMTLNKLLELINTFEVSKVKDVLRLLIDEKYIVISLDKLSLKADR